MVIIIILFDEYEKEFNSIGLGILKDSTSCIVSEKLNDTFDLTLEYPVTGQLYNKIKIGRIIATKPNPYDNIQPFRINSISKPIKGIITIYANHISYDMNGIPCKQIDAKNLNEALILLKQNCLIDNNFNFKTNIQTSKTFKTTSPYNMRALLMGDDEKSLLGVYKAEIKFDKFSAFLYDKRGKNRGSTIRYANNMTDLTHDLTNERLYNGVFPYYHSETESTETVSEDSFTKVYIVGSKPYMDGWLSFSENGEPYHPVDSSPVQIATEGEFFEKVYSWNNTYQKFEQKVYNETVTLVEGIMSPSWIIIDWSKFPNVSCKANAKGYFKLSTDDSWGDIRGVGDTIFEGNVLTSGISGMASNMIIYYSQVIPPNRSSSSQTVTTSVDVILDNPIIWLNTTDAKNMQYNNILSLDLSSYFNEEPTKDQLKNKAEEYISKNMIGTAKYSTTVSFIDIYSTTDKNKYSNFNHIELGDTVKIIYKALGVDVELRVISTEYDAVAERYTNLELGEKSDTLTAESVQTGDNISSLTNDVGYADVTTVNKLIADTVTADFLQAANASMSEAQIKYLQVAKIECSGILEASQLSLDNLVAKLLIADNAKIAETLEAGEIKVAGDITIYSGSINIIDEDNNTSFIVDRSGNVTANSVEITGGSLSINDGMFEVTNDGILTAQNAYIEGEIHATSGEIGDCIISNGQLKISSANITDTLSADKIQGGTIRSSSIILYNDDAETEFNVNSNGDLKANSVELTGGRIQNLDITGRISFGEKYYTTGYEISGSMEEKTETTIFGNYREDRDVNYKKRLKDSLIASRLIQGRDYEDYPDPDDPTAPTQLTHFMKNTILKIYLHKGDYITIESDERFTDGHYEISINSVVTSNLIGEYESAPAKYDQYVYITAIGELTVYHFIIVKRYYRKNNWLSYSEDDDEDVINPTAGNTYYVHLLDGKTQYFLFNGEIYVTYDYLHPHIDEYGIYMPGIIATETQTSIAGFDITENTMISTSEIYEVGMSSSDSNEFAFWAGKANQFNPNPPFSVTHLGELSATKGHIANFVIDANTIHSEEKDSIDSDEIGLYLGDDGFAFKGSYDGQYEDPYFDPSDHSDIKLYSNGEYGDSYISNILLYNASQKVYSYKGNSDGSTPSSSKCLPIGLGYYSYDLYATTRYSPIIVIELGNLITLTAHEWKEFNYTSELFTMPWKKILSVHATIIRDNYTTGTATQGNLDVYFNNSESPYQFWVFNGTSSRQRICVTLIVEREDVKDPNE